METLTADYVVVGAGASGMAFVDELLTHTEHDVLLVDRRWAPGGHWVDAYPFVSLHQPSHYYGVNSMPLGSDEIRTHGPDAGWYERATGREVAEYYRRVLENRFLPSGRVTFLGATDRIGSTDDGVVVESRSTRVRRRLVSRRATVDATYVESRTPWRTPPPFAVADDVDVVTPNELVDVVAPPGGFTVLGAGKTGMDVCCWLLDQGVDPDDITWVRRRDGWFVERTFTQPLELSHHMAAYQARVIEAAGHVRTGGQLARVLEEAGMMSRIDPLVEPDAFRGATISTRELQQLRMIRRTIRTGTVTSVERGRLRFIDGDVRMPDDTVHVDCTAPGLASTEQRPIWSNGRITIQFTTLGVAPWSAALLGFVESLDLPDDEKNRLCPPLPRAGTIDGQLRLLARGLPLDAARRSSAEISAWNATARLNPGRSIADRADRPDWSEPLGRMLQHLGPALEHLRHLA